MTESITIAISLSELRQLLREEIAGAINQDKKYSPESACQVLGISRKTLYNYEKRGTLKPRFTATGKKYYTHDDLQNLSR